MKLNHDLVRLVMLEIEDKATHTNSLDINDLKFPEHTNGEISYVIEKLDEAGLINVNITRFLGGEFIFDITSLTWSGHQFLDNIRDDSVWK